MFQLIGHSKLQADLRKLGQFQRRIYRSMTRKETSYRKQARDIVMRVVYSHKENPLYPRSGNLAASTNVMNSMKASGISAGDGVVTYVFLDPTMATRSFAYTYRGGVDPHGLASYWALIGKGGPKLYPSYVRVGNLFGRPVAARDFRAAWRAHFIPIYMKDAARAVRQFKSG